MRDTILRLLPANRGSIAVEFTLIFILFIFMLLLVAETSRLFYTSANLDFALSEAAKTAKIGTPRTYSLINNFLSTILIDKLLFWDH